MMNRTGRPKPKEALCKCGCGSVLTKSRSGNQVYVLGHSPHGHYSSKRRNDANGGILAPRTNEPPESCPKCQNRALGIDFCDDFTMDVCPLCGWVGFRNHHSELANERQTG